jgi:hypothetical protein
MGSQKGVSAAVLAHLASAASVVMWLPDGRVDLMLCALAIEHTD